MASMLPVAMFGLEVPADEIAVPGRGEIPYGFRITMAAIDPGQTPTGGDISLPRATLKIIRQSLLDDYDDDDDDDDDDDFDVDEMDRLLAGEDSEDSEDSDDELVNGGPSDPAKTKAARKAAAKKAIKELLAGEGGMDLDSSDEQPNGINGTGKSAKALGKMPASDEDEDDSDSSEDPVVDEYVLCTLDPAKHYQQTLDLTIGERERVFFKVTGTHTVYLTGNYVLPPDDTDEDDEDEDEDDEDDYGMDPYGDALDDLDDLDEEDELDDVADPRITEVDDEDEDEAPALVEAAKKVDKKGKNKRAAEEDDSMTLDDSIAQAKKAEANGEQKLSKKQQKKLKKNDGTAAATPEAPALNKSDKKVSFAKNLEQGPTPTKDSKAADQKPNGALGVKVVQGITIDDKKLGSGPAAKSGDRVSMRYIGKLQKDNKVFDKNTKGKPFSFKLGAGEVIKGWDIGIQGMSAGGERRLTIPAHLAYGKQAMGDIPSNSTLVFDVKALEIKKK